MNGTRILRIERMTLSTADADFFNAKARRRKDLRRKNYVYLKVQNAS